MQSSSSLEKCLTVRTDEVHTADAQTSARTGPVAWSLEKTGDASMSLPVESMPKAASSYSRCQATSSKHIFTSGLVRKDTVTMGPKLRSSCVSVHVMLQVVGGSMPD